MKKILTALIVVGALLISAATFLPRYYLSNDFWGFSPIEKSPFSGEIPPEPLFSQMPLGVMIENELNARPFQKGLSRAQIVYEAPAEGGITRFLALFNDYDGKMGPVRSARSYYLDWAHEYNGIYAHVGGHEDVLYRLNHEDIYNADQFFNENYFWRENIGKTALEHTMFTTGTRLRDLIQDKKWQWHVPIHLAENNPPVPIENVELFPLAKNIDINFGFPTYRVKYEYDEINKKYLRSQAGKPHLDMLDATQISPEIVIIQRIKSWSNGDNKGTISMQTVGSGNATIFYQGYAITAMWEKESLKSPTRFFYMAPIAKSKAQVKNLPEKEFTLQKGAWIEILPLQNNFSYE